MKEGWTLKDASPFNIQFIGSRPVFIDVPSFVPWAEGESWIAYRQFCCGFLIPLMMRAHLGIDHLPLMRLGGEGLTSFFEPSWASDGLRIAARESDRPSWAICWLKRREQT